MLLAEGLLTFLIFFGIAMLGVGGLALYGYYMEKKRTEKWQVAADELGLEFFPQGDADLQSRLNNFQLCGLGRSRKVTNLIQGTTDEVKLAIFDYQYTTGSGKNQTTHKQTVAMIESPNLEVPNFSMRAEGFFDRIGSAMGFQDIDFDEYPKFSDMYVLKADSETAAREFFDEPIIRFFESKPPLSVETHFGGSMIFFNPSRRRKPEELKELLAEGYEVFGLMLERMNRP